MLDDKMAPPLLPREVLLLREEPRLVIELLSTLAADEIDCILGRDPLRFGLPRLATLRIVSLRNNSSYNCNLLDDHLLNKINLLKVSAKNL